MTGLENESCSVLKKCQEPIRKLVWVLADSQPCLHLAHSAGQLSFRPVPHYRGQGTFAAISYSLERF